MTTDEFAKGWVMLLTAFPEAQKDLTEKERIARRNLYHSMTRHLDGAHWQEAVGVCVASGKWFPKVSELLDAATQLRGLSQGASGGDGAFELAVRAVRRLDPLHHRPMSDVREDVESVVRALGGWQRLALVEDDQLGWYRKEFLGAWNERYGAVARAGMLDERLSKPALAEPGAHPLGEGEGAS